MDIGKIVNFDNKPLGIINNVYFTSREIDIIACILAGRSPKKIGLLLAISSKTVENHIRNIMLKIGCNFREQVIDFVEKSDQLIAIKKYYTRLLIKIIFEQKLKKIEILIKNRQYSCLIICHKTQNNKKEPLVDQLATHLSIAGITASSRNWNNNISPQDTSKTDHVIYNLTPTFIEHISANNLTLSAATLELIDQEIITANNKPILLLEKNMLLQLGENCTDFSCIVVDEQTNYYFIVFEILEKILMCNEIKNIYKEFKKQHAMLCDYAFLNQNTINDEFIYNEVFNNIHNNHSSFTSSLQGSLMVIFGISFLILLMYNLSNWYFYNNDHTFLLSALPIRKTQIWNVPKQDHIFIGRRQLLKNLNDILHINKKQTFSTPVVINACAGLGGIGKTQLVLQHINENKNKYSIVAWFQSENINSLKQQYVLFARNLGFREENPSVKRVVSYVKQWLKTHPGWLLVFDNLNKYEEIAAFLPNKGGYILITSRIKEWPNKVNVLAINVMEENESIELVTKLSGRKEPRVRTLVKTLGYLPLALVQASTYIKENQITIDEYLKRYNNFEQLMLADNSTGINNVSVATVWNVTLDAIEKESKEQAIPPIAHILITVCAYLESENIPKHLLLTWIEKCYPNFGPSEMVLDKLLNILKKYSMISVDNNNVSLHRLLQSILRFEHSNDVSKVFNLNYPRMSAKWYKNILDVAHKEFTLHTNALDDETRKLALLPHLQALIKNYNNFWQDSTDSYDLTPSLNNLLKDIGFVFNSLNEDPLSAKFYYENILKIEEEMYGKEDYNIVNILNILGNIYRNLSDIPKALELFERALKIQLNNPNKNKAILADTFEYLGDIHRQSGDPKKGKILLEEALKIKKSIYKEYDPSILNAEELLAVIYRQLGDFAAAIKLLNKVITTKEHIYGKEHWRLAFPLVNLSQAHRQSGNLLLSKKMTKRALKLFEQHYGADHWQTVPALENLGNTFRQLGNISQAKIFLERSTKIKENFYGKRHWQTAYAVGYLAITYLETNELQKAKKLLQFSLKIQQKFYGKRNWRVANNLDNLANVYCKQGNYNKAKKLLFISLNIKENHFGKDSWPVAVTLRELAKTYQASGNEVKSRTFLEKAITIQEHYFGKDHWQVLLTKKVVTSAPTHIHPKT